MPIYFLRHGESEANEQNRFAGRQNTPLTDLGIRQADQAGRAVAGLGIRFDEVHTSTLDRARQTAEIVLGHLPEPPRHRVETPALDERDFGEFTAANKSLVKKASGFRAYTEYFHSTTGTPPAGETWHDLYTRVRDHYLNVLLPASEAGRSILVVTHKYVVEMFAVVIAGIDGYRDLKVPNARPLSEEDLRRIAHAPAARARLDDLGEKVEIHLPRLLVAGCAAGVVLHLVTGARIPAPALTATVMVLLAFSTFFGMLRLSPNALRDTKGLTQAVAHTALKAATGTAVLLLAHDLSVQLLGMALLVPPATLAPTLALLWGGDFHASARHTLVASLVMPVPLAVLALTRPDEVPATVLLACALTLVCSVAVPSLAAQRLRRRNPISAGHLTTNWGWLGTVSLVPAAGLAGCALAPRIALPDEPAPFVLATAVAVVLVLVVPRLFAGLPENSRHLYVTHGTPNVFLWVAMTAPLIAQADVDAKLIPTLVLWTFFVALIVDETVFVTRFRTAARHAVIRSSRNSLRAIRTPVR